MFKKLIEQQDVLTAEYIMLIVDSIETVLTTNNIVPNSEDQTQFLTAIKTMSSKGIYVDRGGQETIELLNPSFIANPDKITDGTTITFLNRVQRSDTTNNVIINDVFIKQVLVESESIMEPNTIVTLAYDSENDRFFLPKISSPLSKPFIELKEFLINNIEDIDSKFQGIKNNIPSSSVSTVLYEETLSTINIEETNDEVFNLVDIPSRVEIELVKNKVDLVNMKAIEIYNDLKNNESNLDGLENRYETIKRTKSLEYAEFFDKIFEVGIKEDYITNGSDFFKFQPVVTASKYIQFIRFQNQKSHPVIMVPYSESPIDDNLTIDRYTTIANESIDVPLFKIVELNIMGVETDNIIVNGSQIIFDTEIPINLIGNVIRGYFTHSKFKITSSSGLSNNTCFIKRMENGYIVKYPANKSDFYQLYDVIGNKDRLLIDDQRYKFEQDVIENFVSQNKELRTFRVLPEYNMDLTDFSEPEAFVMEFESFSSTDGVLQIGNKAQLFELPPQLDGEFVFKRKDDSDLYVPSSNRMLFESSNIIQYNENIQNGQHIYEISEDMIVRDLSLTPDMVLPTAINNETALKQGDRIIIDFVPGVSGDEVNNIPASDPIQSVIAIYFASRSIPPRYDFIGNKEEYKSIHVSETLTPDQLDQITEVIQNNADSKQSKLANLSNVGLSWREDIESRKEILNTKAKNIEEIRQDFDNNLRNDIEKKISVIRADLAKYRRVFEEANDISSGNVNDLESLDYTVELDEGTNLPYIQLPEIVGSKVLKLVINDELGRNLDRSRVIEYRSPRFVKNVFPLKFPINLGDTPLEKTSIKDDYLDLMFIDSPAIGKEILLFIDRDGRLKAFDSLTELNKKHITNILPLQNIVKNKNINMFENITRLDSGCLEKSVFVPSIIFGTFGSTKHLNRLNSSNLNQFDMFPNIPYSIDAEGCIIFDSLYKGMMGNITVSAELKDLIDTNTIEGVPYKITNLQISGLPASFPITLKMSPKRTIDTYGVLTFYDVENIEEGTTVTVVVTEDNIIKYSHVPDFLRDGFLENNMPLTLGYSADYFENLEVKELSNVMNNEISIVRKEEVLNVEYEISDPLRLLDLGENSDRVLIIKNNNSISIISINIVGSRYSMPTNDAVGTLSSFMEMLKTIESFSYNIENIDVLIKKVNLYSNPENYIHSPLITNLKMFVDAFIQSYEDWKQNIENVFSEGQDVVNKYNNFKHDVLNNIELVFDFVDPELTSNILPNNIELDVFCRLDYPETGIVETTDIKMAILEHDLDSSSFSNYDNNLGIGDTIVYNINPDDGKIHIFALLRNTFTVNLENIVREKLSLLQQTRTYLEETFISPKTIIGPRNNTITGGVCINKESNTNISIVNGLITNIRGRSKGGYLGRTIDSNETVLHLDKSINNNEVLKPILHSGDFHNPNNVVINSNSNGTSIETIIGNSGLFGGIKTLGLTLPENNTNIVGKDIFGFMNHRHILIEEDKTSMLANISYFNENMECIQRHDRKEATEDRTFVSMTQVDNLFMVIMTDVGTPNLYLKPEIYDGDSINIKGLVFVGPDKTDVILLNKTISADKIYVFENNMLYEHHDGLFIRFLDNLDDRENYLIDELDNGIDYTKVDSREIHNIVTITKSELDNSSDTLIFMLPANTDVDEVVTWRDITFHGFTVNDKDIIDKYFIFTKTSDSDWTLAERSKKIFSRLENKSYINRDVGFTYQVFKKDGSSNELLLYNKFSIDTENDINICKMIGNITLDIDMDCRLKILDDPLFSNTTFASIPPKNDITGTFINPIFIIRDGKFELLGEGNGGETLVRTQPYNNKYGFRGGINSSDNLSPSMLLNMSDPTQYLFEKTCLPPYETASENNNSNTIKVFPAVTTKEKTRCFAALIIDGFGQLSILAFGKDLGLIDRVDVNQIHFKDLISSNFSTPLLTIENDSIQTFYYSSNGQFKTIRF